MDMFVAGKCAAVMKTCRPDRDSRKIPAEARMWTRRLCGGRGGASAVSPHRRSHVRGEARFPREAVLCHVHQSPGHLTLALPHPNMSARPLLPTPVPTPLSRVREIGQWSQLGLCSCVRETLSGVRKRFLVNVCLSVLL